MPLSPRALSGLLRDDDAAVARAVRDAGGVRSLLATARQQGVSGMVLARLETAGQLSDEERARERVRDVEAGLWLDRATLALGRLSSALADAGVRALTLKGPALAERLYPEAPQHRLSVDLDLLVTRGSLEPAVAALAPLGWTRDDGAWNRYLAQHHHAIHLEHEGQPTVDLHFVASAGVGVPLPAEPMLERAVPHRTRLGATVLVPSPEDELIYLCVHAVAHRLARLVWLHDIARLVARTPIDLELARERARAARVEGALLLVASALRRELGVSLPLGRTSGRASLRVALAAALIQAPVHDPGPLDSALTLGVTTLACDRPRDAVVHASTKVRALVERLARYGARRVAPPV